MRSRNAYGPATRLPATHLSACAYLDLLGFTRAVREAEACGRADQLLRRLSSVVTRWFHSMRDYRSAAWKTRRDREVKIFTDNVVIGEPVVCGADFAIWSVVSSLALLQIGLVVEGFFVRGGVSVGNLYMNTSIVYGAALLDAHDVEGSVVTPRVVLHDTGREIVTAYLREYYAQYDLSTLHRFSGLLLQDEDDRLFVNYLSQIFIAGQDVPDYATLEAHRTILQSRLVAHADEPRVLEKYMWAARYHNYFCARHDLMRDYSIANIKPLAPLELSECHHV